MKGILYPDVGSGERFQGVTNVSAQTATLDRPAHNPLLEVSAQAGRIVAMSIDRTREAEKEG